MYKPLADKIRPTALEDVVGQAHILGKQGMLSRIILSENIPNMIFTGPSGIGKTTVANIIANKTQRTLYRLNATTASISDIKEIVSGLNTLISPNGALIYLDEIQYFNKKQQQSLLEFMENGSITLIASTTENPYFYIYNAVLSRSTIFEFKLVGKDDMLRAIERGFLLVQEAGECAVESGVLECIAERSAGDVRKALNAVELLYNSMQGGIITLEDAQKVSQRSHMNYDRDGDGHYDLLSAFQKSIRGSDPHASVYYLARILSGGDMLSVCRRLLVIASEDISLAYPQAISVVYACVESARSLGMPEARIPLGQATVFLATAPKSNSAFMAIDSVMEDVKNGKVYDVPQHLRDSHYQGAKKLKRGLNYKYPHNFERSYVAQQYLPDEIKDVRYYEYGNNKAEQIAKKYWDAILHESKNNKG